ncbi:MAG: restriction endonuclease, partial [Saprospiraceae bacterium]|nr:restriction endonuclease [Saprospiraceae bacterium]
EKGLLSLKVCDVACGSGHILLAAARRIGLALARVRTGEDQPNPAAMRLAVRDAIRHCIYGVDKNPLAVELCKVALWLEAHNPGQPLNFLDHKIKCGDAIVGLALRSELERGIPDEAFKTLPEDDKDITKALVKRNKDERKQREVQNLQLQTDFEKTLDNHAKEALKEYEQFLHLPETTPEEIATKEKNYRRFIDGKGYTWQKIMADAQVAQFFIEKNAASKDLLLTDGEYRQMLAGYRGWQTQKTAKATGVAAERRFFHWFLEFPEVFAGGGFDCVLGNPPFLGDKKLRSTFGIEYLEYLKTAYAPAGAIDLVAYFFRRIFSILKPNGFQSLIATNTIAQGSTREGGLEVILQENGTINHAVRSMRWPGLAAVEVALVTIFKGAWLSKATLDQKSVAQITPYLDDAEPLGNPHALHQNQGKSFIGSYVLGMGFIMEPEEAQRLIAQNPDNEDVLFPYLNGEDLNSSPDQSPSRWVINFFDWPIRRYSEEEWKGLDRDRRDDIRTHFRNGKFEAIAPPDYKSPVGLDYFDVFKIVEEKVKPERQRWKKDENGNDIFGTFAVRDPMPERYWHYGEKRPALYRTIELLDRVLVHTRVTKTHSFDFVQKGRVFSDATIVFAYSKFSSFSCLQSVIHEFWAWQYSSTMKGDRRYAPSDCFETFPFPQNLPKPIEAKLEAIGSRYHEHRRQLMLAVQLGLTKTYNQFHNQQLMVGKWQSAGEVEKAAGKDTAYLWKHLEKTPGTIPFGEAVERILQLRHLHVQMDEAVLEAYGWHEDSAKWGKAIALRHDFHEVDYLPENDRTRFTIHPDARKEVLKRLLLLNHEVYAEEVKQGLHEKGRKAKPKAAPEEESGNGDEPREYLPGEQGRLFEIGGRQGRLF